jgi:hypothetical protein
MEDFMVACYLFDQRPEGRYLPKVSVQLPGGQGKPQTVVITDPEGPTYRDLNRSTRAMRAGPVSRALGEEFDGTTFRQDVSKTRIGAMHPRPRTKASKH